MAMRPVTRRTAAALLSLVALVSLARAEPHSPKRVLLIRQNEEYSPAALETEKGILDELRKHLGEDTEFFGEQLEATRFPKSQEQALDWIRTRYTGRGIDVVIFVGSTLVDILPGVPTVYAGHNAFKLPDDSSNRDGKVTVWFKVDVGKTVSLARRLQPQAKNMLVIAGSGYEDHMLLDQLRDQFKESDLHVEYLVDAPVEDLVRRVSMLPRDTIVMPLSYNRDPKGNIFYTRDVVAALSAVSTAPIYAMADTTMGSGAVGGYVVDFEKMGKVVADVALETLKGKARNQFTISPDETSTYIFDWRQLKQWGFSENDLPEGSIILFKTTSVWEQYRWRIIGIIVLVIAQFFLILRLLISQRRRARAEASLARHDRPFAGITRRRAPPHCPRSS